MQSKDLVFFGRIAASFTHELKNVLAIVKETSGLMEDLLAVTREDAFPHRERFARAVATIQSQVGRGVDLATRMNRLAHAPDHARAAVELNDTLTQVALLAERLARIKGVAIEAIPSAEGVSLVTSPVGIQRALFTALECCWTAMSSGAGVEARVQAGPPIAVAFSWRGAAQDDVELRGRLRASTPWEELEEAARALGATLHAACPGALFVLTFPSGQESSNL